MNFGICRVLSPPLRSVASETMIAPDMDTASQLPRQGPPQRITYGLQAHRGSLGDSGSRTSQVQARGRSHKHFCWPSRASPQSGEWRRREEEGVSRSFLPPPTRLFANIQILAHDSTAPFGRCVGGGLVFSTSFNFPSSLHRPLSYPSHVRPTRGGG